DVVVCIADQEVDVVKCIQHLSAEFEVCVLGESDSLHHTQIRTEERWSFENEVLEPATTHKGLIAIQTCRRDVASSRCSLRVNRKAGAGSERDIERLEGVLTDIERQGPNVTAIDTIGIRLVPVNTHCILKFLGSHADQ